jgi:hypothetical protein
MFPYLVRHDLSKKKKLVCIEFVHLTQHSSVVRLRGQLALSAAAGTLSITVVSACAVGAVVGVVLGSLAAGLVRSIALVVLADTGNSVLEPSRESRSWLRPGW